MEAQYQAKEQEIIQGYRRQLTDAIRKAVEKARAEQTQELVAMQEQLAEQRESIDQLQRAELDLRKQKREIEAREKALALEIERRIDERCKQVEQETVARLSDEHHLKDLERDRQLADLRRQLEEANRKVKQGSQQLQGEVAEDDLAAQLRQAFPRDVIEKVNVGQRGADVLHKVIDASGRQSGSILYEVKNTKAFSDHWLAKLREDQRAVGAEIAVVVTTSLPKDISTFAQRAGVWVTGQPTWLALAYALRFGVAEVARARILTGGQAEKQAALVAYCAGVEFRQRIDALRDPIGALQTDLNTERRCMQSWWATRDKRYQQIMGAAIGLYGDIEGITGMLPKLTLELPDGDDGQEKVA
jgi:hypothetical protein